MLKNEIFFLLTIFSIYNCVRVTSNDNDIITYKLKAKSNLKDYAVSLLHLRHTNTTETSINIKIAKKLVNTHLKRLNIPE
jgi:hypothetical protein